MELVEMRRRNNIGYKSMLEEIEEANERRLEEIRDYKNMKDAGEEIDLDACIHMAVSNFEAERYQIMCKYIDRGLPADYAEEVALHPECYTSRMF